MTDSRDPRLQAAFDALRDADAAHVPSFDAMVARASVRDVAPPVPLASTGRRGRALALAAAAVIVAAVGLTVVRSPRTDDPDNRPDSRATAAARQERIDTWRAPTDVLLDYTGREFLYSPQPIGASALDRFIPDSRLLKGGSS